MLWLDDGLAGSYEGSSYFSASLNGAYRIAPVLAEVVAAKLYILGVAPEDVIWMSNDTTNRQVIKEIVDKIKPLLPEAYVEAARTVALYEATKAVADRIAKLEEQAAGVREALESAHAALKELQFGQGVNG